MPTCMCSMILLILRMFYKHYEFKQEQRKRGIIRPSTLVKNNKLIQLKSELEL
jgi:hypothetical protein